MPAVDLEIATEDDALIARLAGPQGAVPGTLHAITSGALLAYEGPAAAAPDGTPAHVFRLEFGTPNVAATAANWLWSQLQGHVVTVSVAGQEVPMHHAALKSAMLDAVGLMQPI
jgi:hypothetical protein